MTQIERTAQKWALAWTRHKIVCVGCREDDYCPTGVGILQRRDVSRYEATKDAVLRLPQQVLRFSTSRGEDNGRT